MGPLAVSLVRRISRVMFACAALFLALMPLLDSTAKAAAWAPPGTWVHALSAFDVVDDVLDHLPGEPAGPQQQHLQVPHAFPEPVETASLAAPAGRAAWRWERQLAPPSTSLESQDPPPRA